MGQKEDRETDRLRKRNRQKDEGGGCEEKGERKQKKEEVRARDKAFQGISSLASALA